MTRDSWLLTAGLMLAIGACSAQKRATWEVVDARESASVPKELVPAANITDATALPDENWAFLDVTQKRLLTTGDSIGIELPELGSASSWVSPLHLTSGQGYTVHVFDHGGLSLNTIDLNSKRVSSFLLSPDYGETEVAEYGPGLLILNPPREGVLFTVYDMDGRFHKSIGETRSRSEDPLISEYLNRQLMSVVNDSIIVAVEVYGPHLSGYEIATSRLIMEKELKLKEYRQYNQEPIRIQSGKVFRNKLNFEICTIEYEGAFKVILITYARKDAKHILNILSSNGDLEEAYIVEDLIDDEMVINVVGTRTGSGVHLCTTRGRVLTLELPMHW